MATARFKKVAAKKNTPPAVADTTAAPKVYEDPGDDPNWYKHMERYVDDNLGDQACTGGSAQAPPRSPRRPSKGKSAKMVSYIRNNYRKETAKMNARQKKILGQLTQQLSLIHTITEALSDRSRPIPETCVCNAVATTTLLTNIAESLE